MDCTIVLASYNYGRNKDEERILLAEKATKAASKEGRLAKKEAKQQEEDGFLDDRILLYGLGIAD